MAAGTKSHLVPCSYQGRKRRVPVGSTDAISLAARDAALVRAVQRSEMVMRVSRVSMPARAAR